MEKKILISTGGSGGHVIPATILHDHLCKNKNIIISSDDRGSRFLDTSFYNVKIINNLFIIFTYSTSKIESSRCF